MDGKTSRKVEVIFRKGGGALRMSEAVRQGVHRDTLRQMVSDGLLEKAGRGLYCLPGLLEKLPHPDLAVTAALPRIHYPPVRVFRFGGKSFDAGVEVHGHGPFVFRVYSREKSLADCFKFRRVVGLETCLEALKKYRDSGRFDGDLLERQARVCRVERVMRPYLEAVV